MFAWDIQYGDERQVIRTQLQASRLGTPLCVFTRSPRRVSISDSDVITVYLDGYELFLSVFGYKLLGTSIVRGELPCCQYSHGVLNTLNGLY